MWDFLPHPPLPPSSEVTVPTGLSTHQLHPPQAATQIYSRQKEGRKREKEERNLGKPNNRPVHFCRKQSQNLARNLLLLESYFVEAEPGLREAAWHRKREPQSGMEGKRTELCFCQSPAVGLKKVTSSFVLFYLQVKRGSWTRQVLLAIPTTHFCTSVSEGFFASRNALFHQVELSYPKPRAEIYEFFHPEAKPIFQHTWLKSSARVYYYVISYQKQSRKSVTIYWAPEFTTVFSMFPFLVSTNS